MSSLTLCWRKLHYVANYAYLVLFVGSKIFICAILYAFSISVIAQPKRQIYSFELLNKSVSVEGLFHVELLAYLKSVTDFNKMH